MSSFISGQAPSSVSLDPSGGLGFSDSGQVQIKLDETTTGSSGLNLTTDGIFANPSLYNFTFTRSGAVNGGGYPFSIGDAEKKSRSSFVIPVDSELIRSTIISYTSTNAGSDNNGRCLLISNGSILNIYAEKLPNVRSNVVKYSTTYFFPEGTEIGLFAETDSPDSVFTSVSLIFRTVYVPPVTRDLELPLPGRDMINHTFVPVFTPTPLLAETLAYTQQSATYEQDPTISKFYSITNKKEEPAIVRTRKPTGYAAIDKIQSKIAT